MKPLKLHNEHRSINPGFDVIAILAVGIRQSRQEMKFLAVICPLPTEVKLQMVRIILLNFSLNLGLSCLYHLQ